MVGHYLSLTFNYNSVQNVSKSQKKDINEKTFIFSYSCINRKTLIYLTFKLFFTFVELAPLKTSGAQ